MARNGKVTMLRHLYVPYELLEQVVLFLSANMPRKMGLPAVKDSQKSVKKKGEIEMRVRAELVGEK